MSTEFKLGTQQNPLMATTITVQSVAVPPIQTDFKLGTHQNPLNISVSPGAIPATALATGSQSQLPTVTETVNFNAAFGNIYEIDLSSGNVQATLPAIASADQGKFIYFFIKAIVAGNQLTVIVNNSVTDTINYGLNGNQLILDQAGQSQFVCHNGSTNWMVFG